MAPLLEVKNLSVSFTVDEGRLAAVNDVSFHIHKGEVVGIVGESGCGKSVTAMSALRLLPSPPGHVDAGEILFEGEDLLTVPINRLRRIRGRRISMIFQEPMTALSPLQRVGRQLIETLRTHLDISPKDAARTATEWLEKVGIPDAEQRMRAYPFQLSGGMRQRVMIAMALMLAPALVIADEPTTALDVTIQAQIFDLMRQMKQQDSSLLLITHDMGVIWDMCDRVIVMYASQVVEEGSVQDVFKRPQHPYTQGLLRSMPTLSTRVDRLPSIEGQVPSPLQYPTGCHFRDRCDRAFGRCEAEPAPMVRLASGQLSRCFLALDEAAVPPAAEGGS